MSPDMKCVCFVLVYLCSFAIAQPNNRTEVNLVHEWKPGVGWVVTCSWELAPNDRLQSVSLYRNNQHFVNYRPGPPPKFNGPHLHHIFPTLGDDMELTCEEIAANCTLVIQPIHPPKEDIEIMCEVSGEGPLFRVGIKNLVIQAVVPPSDAVLEVSKETEDSNPVLNCSATGIPAPKIEWTVGNDDTKISSFHSSRVWNVTSKLWEAWSTFMPASDQLPVRCTAKVLKGNTQYTSKVVEYNAAIRIELSSLGILLATAFLVLIR